MDRKQFDRPEHVVKGEIAKTKLSDEVVRAANLHLLAKEGANRVDRASNACPCLISWSKLSTFSGESGSAPCIVDR